MKTTSLKPLSAGLLARLTLLTTVSLFVLSCTAQNAWEASEVKGKVSIFKCFTVGDKEASFTFYGFRLPVTWQF